MTDPHTLVGPYVLDALPPDERAQFEEHLERCPECRDEVAGLHAAAAHLGQAAAVDPPADLRQRVLSEVARTRQVAPGPSASAASFARRRWPVVAAAAAVLVIAALGVLLAQADRRADRAEQLAAVIADPEARSIEVAGDGGTMRLVASPDRASSVLLAEDMPAPPAGKTYALWYQEGGHMVPAGLFEPDADGSVQAQVDRVPTGVVGVTIEPAGGSDEPTLPIIAQGSL